MVRISGALAAQGKDTEWVGWLLKTERGRVGGKDGSDSVTKNGHGKETGVGRKKKGGGGD